MSLDVNNSLTPVRRVSILALHVATMQDALRPLYRRYGAFYPSGSAVVRQGESGQHLYVVLEGTIEFSVHDPATGSAQMVRRASPGEIFGVTSCFTGLRHTATVTAVGDAHLLRFRQDAVSDLIQTSPTFAMRVIETLIDRLQTATERNLSPPPPGSRG